MSTHGILKNRLRYVEFISISTNRRGSSPSLDMRHNDMARLQFASHYFKIHITLRLLRQILILFGQF